jgi:hypothetical protein
MSTKEEILKGIEFLENRKPSSWDLALILRIKQNLLPKIKDYVLGVETFIEDKKDIVKEAESVFDVKSESSEKNSRISDSKLT